jgi:hypothetical protein
MSAFGRVRPPASRIGGWAGPGEEWLAVLTALGFSGVFCVSGGHVGGHLAMLFAILAAFVQL